MTGQSSAKMEQVKPRVMHTPRTLDLEITSRCNLHCDYCYFFNNPAINYHDLPTEQWLKFFDELGRCAVINVTLSGGEPFIRQDLPVLLDGIVRNRMRFSILTNGTLINNDIASFIAKTSRCDYIQISVDGSRPEIHDICRGKGAFKDAIQGIKILQSHDIPVSVRMTIHRHNIHDLENTAHFLLKELGVPQLSTNSAGYFGSCRFNPKNILLSIQERQKAMEVLVYLSEKYKGRISAMAGPLADARNWDRMEKARASEADSCPSGGYLTGCNCTNQRIAVRSDGKFIPCSMLAHMALGCINKNALVEVWQENSILNQLRQRCTIPLTDFDFCHDCPYIPYCTGNCPGLAYTLTGQVHHPNPDACLKQFLESGGSLPENACESIPF
jgi:SynChlorMet cassette radical SAM/SPASM protein ScmE